MRRILITGATSGIGRAVADHLSLTDLVWALGSTSASLVQLSDPARLAGSGFCDVRDWDAVVAAVAGAATEMGGFDAVFVNAGIDGVGETADRLATESLRAVLEVNVLGAFNVAKASLAHLDRPGTIVFNASVNAVRPEPRFLDYNVSKAAVVSMAQSMALDLSGDGVTVIALCPGYFPTRMTAPYVDNPKARAEILSRIPARRLGDLGEIAETVDFLLGPAARFMTGGVVTLDGGSHLS